MSVRNATTLGSNNNDYSSSTSQQQSPTTVVAAATTASRHQVNKHLYDTMLEPSTHHLQQDPMTDTESMHSIQVSQTSSVKPLQQDIA